MRKAIFAILLAGLTLASVSLLSAAANDSTRVDDFTGRPRVIVISDIGNEPDDQMSFVRFLMYSNEFEAEGLIAAPRIRRLCIR